jgi:hypothetical protein
MTDILEELDASVFKVQKAYVTVLTCYFNSCGYYTSWQESGVNVMLFGVFSVRSTGKRNGAFLCTLDVQVGLFVFSVYFIVLNSYAVYASF